MITTPWLLRFGQVAEEHVHPQEAAASELLSGEASVELWRGTLLKYCKLSQVTIKGNIEISMLWQKKNKWRRVKFTPSGVPSSHKSRLTPVHFQSHTVLLTVSAIIVHDYCYFFIKSRRYKINYSQTEWRLKAGLFTHGWTEDPQTYSFSRLIQAELHIFIRAKYFNLH